MEDAGLDAMNEAPSSCGPNKEAAAGPAPDAANGSRAPFGEMLGAFLWGFAEATFFFIVPDVLLSFIAVRRGLRVALKGVVAALIGAVLGGLLMYSWGAGAKLKVIVPFLDVIPAISRTMILETLAALEKNGASTLFIAAFTGVPYKIPAALAPHAGLSLSVFLVMSVLARGLRFVLSALLAAGIATLWRRTFRRLSPLWAWAGFWAVFYTLWFLLMPS